MKGPKKHPHPIRKENRNQLRTAHYLNGLDVAVTQSSALQSEIGLPAIRAVWSMIDDKNTTPAKPDRRRKR